MIICQDMLPNLLTMVYILWSIIIFPTSTWAGQNVTLLVSPKRLPEISEKSAPTNITEIPTTLSLSPAYSTSSLPPRTSAGSLTSSVFGNTEVTGYIIDSSKPIHQTILEVTRFLCGQAYFCDSTLDVEVDMNDCFACQFPCSCEAECEHFGDCCVDRLLRSFNSSNSSITDCVTIGEISSYMVTKCPLSYQDFSNTLRQCEIPDVSQIEQALPVSVKTNQVTYRNKYCAICNGLQEKEFENWSYKINCPGNASTHLYGQELWEFVNKSPDVCSVKYLPPTGVISRHCPHRMVTTCSIDNNNVNIISMDLCKQFVNPIIYRGITYKNIFCAICNGVMLDKDDLCGLLPDADIDMTLATSRPLSAFMNFDPMFEPESHADITEPGVEAMCKLGNIYDPFQNECLIPQCSERRTLIRGKCESLFATAKGLGYSVFIIMVPGRGISRWGAFTTEYMAMLRKLLAPLYPYYIHSVRFHIFVSLDDTNGTEILNGVTVEADILILKDAPLGMVEEILQNLFVVSWAFKSADESITIKSASYSCSGSSDKILFDRIQDETIKGSPELLEGECDENCLDQIEFTDFKYNNLRCPFVELSLLGSNLKYVKNTSTLVALDGILVINASSYLKCGDNIWVCIGVLEGIQLTSTTTTTMLTPVENHTTHVEYKPKEGKSLAIVSTVCITLSMAFLVLVFLVHCFLPKLRTTTGKNTMFTILNLFLAQLFFLSGQAVTENSSMCRTIGIIVHYFWVSSFIWLAVDAHYIYIQCSKLIGGSENHLDKKGTLIRNTLLSNGFPVVIILVCISYHLANSLGTEVGYGDNVCFLSKPGDIGMYFVGPLGIALGCNIYFFIVTVGVLRRMPDALEINNRPKKAVAMLYFKWSIFVGVSWVFGCFAAALNSEVLWYICIILCGFQGIFIFVTFCASELTWKMLKEKFERFVPKKLPVAVETLDGTQTISSRV